MSAALRAMLAIGSLCAAGCVSPEAPPVVQQPALAQRGSLLPGTIGVVVKAGAAGVVVAAVGENGPAAAAGLRAGDIVLRYNGVSVADSSQFYRMVLESAPGSTAQLELLREGTVHRVDVPVEEIDTAWRAGASPGPARGPKRAPGAGRARRRCP